MAVQLTEEQNSLIKTIAIENGYNDYELATSQGSIKGDNYMGIITKITVKQGEKKLELIMKSASSNEAFRKTTPIRKVFLREMFIYDKIFPEFEKFQKENQVSKPFLGHPKYYGGSEEKNHECLIMENLREAGYQLWDRKVPMNSGHISAVMEEYGKFHAISLAMRKKKPDLYTDLTKNLQNIFEENFNGEKLQGFVDVVMESGFKAVKDNDKLKAALKKFESEVPGYFSKEWKDVDELFVILHGDCWCNNMMFKYENPQDIKRPTRINLIDWQLSHIGSPAADLAYFFYTSSPRAILDDYEKYLKIYHNSVTQNLKMFSCDPEELFPYRLLEAHWKRYAKFGMYMSFILLKIMLAESDEAPDFDELADSGKFMEGLKFESINVNDSNQRILDIIESLFNHNLL